MTGWRRNFIGKRRACRAREVAIEHDFTRFRYAILSLVCLASIVLSGYVAYLDRESDWANAMGPTVHAGRDTELTVRLFATAIAASSPLGSSRSVTPGLIAHYVGLFGSGARGRLESWKEYVRGIESRRGATPGGTNDVELLGQVNLFFNRMPASSDIALWNVEDYWATPAEFRSCDCAWST